jgi:hypothetical protein
MLAVFSTFVYNLLETTEVDIGNMNLSTVNNRLVRESFEE